VIALRRGSVPEILEHGTSGWIANDVDGLVRGVEIADRLSSDDCRRRAQEFTAEQMSRRYVRVYREVIANHPCGVSSKAVQRVTRADE